MIIRDNFIAFVNHAKQNRSLNRIASSQKVIPASESRFSYSLGPGILLLLVVKGSEVVVEALGDSIRATSPLA